MPPPHSPSRYSRRGLLGGGLILLTTLCIGGWPGPVEASFRPDQLRLVMRNRYGDRGSTMLEEWFALLERLASQPLQTQLRDTNDFFNRRIRWLDDIDIWGQEDYWATPLETMGKAQGDCEDFSIAKYITLKRLGVPNQQLRMIYVRARIGRRQATQAHMVLGYYETPASEPLVLDNLVTTITPAAQRTDLDPVFSFNSDGLWAVGSTQSRANPLQRLSRWSRALSRMQEQGFL
ncbi:transglutaminase-like cysteine peptidase [Halomonas sp. KAO]|uniref:transglutaminase-like cysteine peptidase n=1 Tax=Halomonas sp. KAO TaxID=2783858 RepID=UPI00189C8EF1|nr:transglutaminase-like cysteine peptidase [Halomonas sp. KAO]MBF7052977.1 transglutaminase-like cysteine peptidase [Halomonas sp. KAO]